MHSAGAAFPDCCDSRANNRRAFDRRYGACVPYRVALYSHDTMGLGHMRRNLLLAQALRHSRLQAVVLMIAGAREASLLTSTDRKSTRLNSSHGYISYAVFCLKKKTTQ